MTTPNDPPLDEIQWRSPQTIASMGGLHSNTVLFYFAESPFFERTSNNAIIMSQAMNNMSMYHYIQTREAFEGRLRTMSGLEFMVGEEPAETGPGMGTGVWVIRKQTRRKQQYQEEDEITVHASFFVVGENIYMAPTLADILASRIMTISSAIAKALPAADSIRKWRPSTGHVYELPTTANQSRPTKAQESKAATPSLPPNGQAATNSTKIEQKTDEAQLERSAEEALLMHMRYGGEYIDENPITGRPGEFHLSTTGRKPVPLPLKKTPETSGIGAMNGPAMGGAKAEGGKKEGRGPKTPKTPKTPKSATTPKLKRKKTKMSAANTPMAS